MKTVHALRIAVWHLALYLFVIAYILMGASVFHYLEGEAELERQVEQKAAIQLFKASLFGQINNRTAEEFGEKLREFISNISSSAISVDEYLELEGTESNAHSTLDVPLTTIGYGNVAPTTRPCQIFTMVFGACGIPLFLVTIADLGRFFKTFIMYLVQLMYQKELKKQGERNLWREIGEVILVAVLFLVFIAAGSAVLPLWEHELTYFNSLYFSYMSLDDDRNRGHRAQLADVFRLVHYAGRQVSNVKGLSVWLGGREMLIGTFDSNGLPTSWHLINWDSTIESALNGEEIPPVPIVPWHFSDFVEKDPPLIDLSLDWDQEDKNYIFAERTVCNSPAHKTWRKMSAPLIDTQRSSAKQSTADK
ncbi:TWiK family of potassium channels protein 9 [Aphelenchoides fujianensis]|nr:TWiK family of potassium channels protein 9 [Aphelenchoides fujianensis]